MSSTFGALNTAFTGLTAARRGMELAGHNIANANTEGYTRQRVNLSGVSAPANAGLFTSKPGAGQGVSVDQIARLGDVFADAQVRSTAAAAGSAGVRAEALASIETTLREPGKDGLAAKMDDFWGAWGDVSNQPGEAAPAAVLLQNAATLSAQIGNGYAELDGQWTSTRAKTAGMVDDLNLAASQIAALNGQIRSTLNAGGTANELMDQRNLLAASVASLAGGAVREKGDGTIDVLVGGNTIVSGADARTVKMAGSFVMGGAAASPAQLEWADKPGQPLALSGGKLAGALTVLAPASGGTGGAIAEAAEAFNALAQKLAADVNAAHQAGATPDGTTGLNFFTFKAGVPAAQGLSVVPTSAAEIAAGTPGKGGLDGSNADAISQTGSSSTSPNAQWATFVTKLGVTAKSENLQSRLTETAANSASQAQVSGSSVNLDEENINLLANQRAYQASARVYNALDEALDTLINRTGLVGR
jgi:flagellar hook-associated protein 1 FlgK